jgi:hypothetical protein
MHEVIVTQMETEDLPSDRRRGFEVIDDLESIRRTGKGRECCIAQVDLKRSPDDERLDGRVLFDNPSVLNDITERLAAAVAARQFPARAARESNGDVVHPHARQCCQTVLDGFDVECPIPQTSSSRTAHDVGYPRRNGGDPVILLPQKRDTGADGRRRKRQRRRLPGKEPGPGKTGLAQDGPLVQHEARVETQRRLYPFPPQPQARPK